MAGEKKEPKTIVGIEARDLYRIRVARLEIQPGGGVKQIVGMNKQGKTSLLRIPAGVLGGKKFIDEGIINDDSEDGTGEAKISLSDGSRIELVCTPSNPKGAIKIVRADGTTSKKQGDLKELIGEGSFDPLVFFRLDEAQQTKILLGFGTDPNLPEKLIELRTTVTGLKEERTPIIRTIQRAERSKAPTGDRPEAVDVSAEMARLDEMEKSQGRRLASLQKARDLLSEAARYTEQEKNYREGILEIEEQLRRKKEAAENSATLARETIAEAAEMQRLTESTLPDIATEIEEVRGKIKEADGVNEDLEPWKEWDRTKDELREAKESRQGYDKQIKQLQGQEKQLLAEAGIDLEGLSFNEEGQPLLWNRTFSLASGREKAEFSVQIAIKHDPELRVCFVDEGTGIDPEGMERLHALGIEHGFDVFLTRLEASGEGEIIVCEDGVAWNKDGVGDAVSMLDREG